MKAYKRMHSRIKYGMITRERIGDWRDDAKAQALLCEQGDLSLCDLKRLSGN